MSLSIQTNAVTKYSNITFGNKKELAKIAGDYVNKSTKGLTKETNNYITPHQVKSSLSDLLDSFTEMVASFVIKFK